MSAQENRSMPSFDLAAAAYNAILEKAAGKGNIGKKLHEIFGRGGVGKGLGAPEVKGTPKISPSAGPNTVLRGASDPKGDEGWASQLAAALGLKNTAPAAAAAPASASQVAASAAKATPDVPKASPKPSSAPASSAPASPILSSSPAPAPGKIILPGAPANPGKLIIPGEDAASKIVVPGSSSASAPGKLVLPGETSPGDVSKMVIPENPARLKEILERRRAWEANPKITTPDPAPQAAVAAPSWFQKLMGQAGDGAKKVLSKTDPRLQNAASKAWEFITKNAPRVSNAGGKVVDFVKTHPRTTVGAGLGTGAAGLGAYSAMAGGTAGGGAAAAGGGAAAAGGGGALKITGDPVADTVYSKLLELAPKALLVGGGLGLGARGLVGLHNLVQRNRKPPAMPSNVLAVDPAPESPEEEKKEKKAAWTLKDLGEGALSVVSWPFREAYNSVTQGATDLAKGRWADSFYSHPLVPLALGGAATAGAVGGFQLADQIMVKRKKQELQEKLDAAKQQYMAALQGKEASALGGKLDELYDRYVEKRASEPVPAPATGPSSGKALTSQLLANYLLFAGLSGAYGFNKGYNWARERGPDRLMEKAKDERYREQLDRRLPSPYAPVPVA